MSSLKIVLLLVSLCFFVTFALKCNSCSQISSEIKCVPNVEDCDRKLGRFASLRKKCVKVEKKGEFTLRKCIIAERKPDKEICEDLIKIDRKLSQLLGQTDFECKVCDTDYCNA